MAFANLVSVAAGTVAGLVTGGITATFAPAHVAVATGVASLVLFSVAPAQVARAGRRSYISQPSVTAQTIWL